MFLNPTKENLDEKSQPIEGVESVYLTYSNHE